MMIMVPSVRTINFPLVLFRLFFIKEYNKVKIKKFPIKLPVDDRSFRMTCGNKGSSICQLSTIFIFIKLLKFNINEIRSNSLIYKIYQVKIKVNNVNTNLNKPQERLSPSLRRQDLNVCGQRSFGLVAVLLSTSQRGTSNPK